MVVLVGHLLQNHSAVKQLDWCGDDEKAPTSTRARQADEQTNILSSNASLFLFSLQLFLPQIFKQLLYHDNGTTSAAPRPVLRGVNQMGDTGTRYNRDTNRQGRKRFRSASSIHDIHDNPWFGRFFVGNVPPGTTVGAVRSCLLSNLDGELTHLLENVHLSMILPSDLKNSQHIFSHDPKQHLPFPSVCVAFVGGLLVESMRALDNIYCKNRKLQIVHSDDVTAVVVRNFLHKHTVEQVSNYFGVPVDSTVRYPENRLGCWLVSNVGTFDAAVALLRKNGCLQRLRSGHPPIRLYVQLYSEKSGDGGLNFASNSLLPAHVSHSPGESDDEASAEESYESGHIDGSLDLGVGESVLISPTDLKRQPLDCAQDGNVSAGSKVAGPRLMSKKMSARLHASRFSKADLESSEPKRRCLNSVARDSRFDAALKGEPPMSPGAPAVVPCRKESNTVVDKSGEAEYVGLAKKEPPPIVSLLDDKADEAHDVEPAAESGLVQIQSGKVGTKTSRKKWRVELSSDSGIRLVPGPAGAWCIEGEAELRYSFFEEP